MAYDVTLADAMRPMLLARPGVSEKNMFGGIAFLVNGNMCCGIHEDLLVVRLNKEKSEEYLKLPYVHVMDITGKPMKGWLFIEKGGYEDGSDLLNWIERAYGFAAALPPKAKNGSRSATTRRA